MIKITRAGLSLAGGTLTGQVEVDLGTITANTQNFGGTATWSNAGVTFTAIKLNITDTASNSASLLMDLQVAGASKFNVSKTGAITTTGGITVSGSAGSTFGSGGFVVAGRSGMNLAGTGFITTYSGGLFGFASGTDPSTSLDTGIARNAAGVLEINSGTNGTLRDLVARNIALPAGTIMYGGTATGLVNVMAATIAPAITAYTAGAFYLVQANITNTTTTPTLNLNGLGAKTIVKRAATALAAGDYVANMMCLFVYDGTNMELLNPVVN